MILSMLVSMLLSFPQTDSVQVSARQDSLPAVIPNVLPPDLFIPVDRLYGKGPWTYAPLVRPVFPIIDIYGFDGSVGFGEYSQQHPEKFFSTLEGYNMIDVPQLYVSQQMMIGNTLKLGKKLYFLSGILYGSQMGVKGNNWGMGTREGVLWHPTALVSVIFWTQYFQSVEVYSPVLFPRPDDPSDSAAIVMPATPEVFSFGVQASFVVGEFIIGIGTSVSPVPFQKRHHSEFRYR